jgi:hypothetical protein
MFYLDSNNNKYYLGKSFRYGDTYYGPKSATHSKFMELGFTQVIIAPRPDTKYYIVSGPDLNGQYTSLPRDLDKLKKNQVNKEKQTAKAKLTLTDWMVIRAMDVGVAVAAVPADVSNFRSAVRGICDARCTAIGSAVTVEELEALVKAPVEVLSDPTDKDSPRITNPDPHLPPWPEMPEEEDNEESN